VAGGSCSRAAGSLIPQRPGLRVVTGVNLPMLLDFVMQAPDGVGAAAARAAEVGGAGIRVVGQ
jgi:mannose/fructose-specific phosphotransferase system component IIA